MNTDTDTDLDKTLNSFPLDMELGESQFHNLLMQSPAAFALLRGKSMVIRLANDTIKEIWGKGNDIEGKTLLDIMPEIQDQGFPELLDKVYTTGIAFYGHETPVRLQRRGVWEELYFNFVYQAYKETDGTITGIAIIANEVTTQAIATKTISGELELRVAERTAELQHEKDFIETILSASNDIIAVLDHDLRYLSFNTRMEELYHKSKKDVLNKTVFEVFPHLTEESGFVQDVRKCLTGETILRPAYKSQVVESWFQNHYVPLKEPDGRIYGAAVIGHDITHIMEASEQIKQVNQALEQKNLELERTNKELESFSYIASHDLQEPLRKIQTFISLLQQNKHNEAAVDKYFGKINSSAQRMSELIQALLNYSKISDSHDPFVQTDLNEILQQAEADFELSIQEKDALIKSDHLPVIKGIPFQLHQLFSNLISNSLKFSQGKPLIVITSRVITGDKIKDQPVINPAQKFAEIHFSDNGIGFEPRFRDQIFKLFQRLHGKTEYTGTGVGLSIVKKIVDNHNGFIAAEGAPTHGATFSIWLPVD